MHHGNPKKIKEDDRRGANTAAKLIAELNKLPPQSFAPREDSRQKSLRPSTPKIVRSSRNSYRGRRSSESLKSSDPASPRYTCVKKNLENRTPNSDARYKYRTARCGVNTAIPTGAINPIAELRQQLRLTPRSFAPKDDFRRKSPGPLTLEPGSSNRPLSSSHPFCDLISEIQLGLQTLYSVPDVCENCIKSIDLLDETWKKWRKDIKENESLKKNLVKYSDENARLREDLESMKLEKTVLQDKLVQCQAVLFDQKENKTDDDVTIDYVESHATYTNKTGTAVDEVAESCLDVETNDEEIKNTLVVAFTSSTEAQKVNLSEISMTNLGTKIDSLGFKNEPKMNFQQTPKLLCLPPKKTRRSLSMPAPKSTRGKKISYKEVVDNKNHDIRSKRIFKNQKCVTCKRTIKAGYQFRQCKDCKCTWHSTCKFGSPCIPFKAVPKTEDGKIKLTDCVTELKPRLPHPVRRCVVVLDKMLHSEKLYSTRFDEKVVKDLLIECIYTKNIDMPDAPEIVSNTLLKFLSELREPLILKTSCDEFLAAAESLDNDELYGVIDDLPKVNRYTLAYLFLHWKNVVRHSYVNNLTAKKLGSIVMKVLMRIPEKKVLDQHIRTFERLLNLEDCEWKKIIEADCYDAPAKGSASTLFRSQSAGRKQC